MNWIQAFFRRLAGSAGTDEETVIEEAHRSHSASASETLTRGPSFDRPQITLFDLDSNVSARLTERGYGNIRNCSFGSPYVDRTSSAWVRPFLNPRLSVDYADSELFIVDMSVPPRKNVRELTGTPAAVAIRRTSFDVDPRPFVMHSCSTALDRALRVGSVFVIFADKPKRFAIASDPMFIELDSREQEMSTWSLLPVLGSFNVRDDFGRDMQIVGGPEKLRRLLAEFLPDSEFSCTFEPIQFHGHDTHIVPGWEVVATNRFGAAVAGLIRDESMSGGIVLLLPRVSHLPEFLAAFVSDVLPTIALHLYPHLQRLEWTADINLELPSLRTLKRELRDVNDAHAASVNKLAEAIERNRSDVEHLMTILTGTDDELRLAVKKTFEEFGFTVVNVDEERATTDREDLRIDDNKPALLIETKGLKGHPSDEDAHQVLKYVPLRREELGRDDIASLTVVNHQRMVSPWERDTKAFRPEIVANAKASNLGLLTTWDLYRLARNARTLNWPLAALRAAVLRTGRIEAIPAHYMAVGNAERVLEKSSVISIRVQGPVAVGDRLAFESDIDFIEFDVNSMQVNKEVVARAEAGTLVGVHVPEAVLAAARVGVCIYRADSAAFA